VPNVIVIGASAGGVEPLRYIVRALPADFPAAIFIVMHLSPLSPSVLPNILGTRGRMKVGGAVDGQPIEPANVYVAPPDMHLLVEPGYMRLSRGPRENRHRPAIDPLFRSAARSYGSRVIGIVLTGMLDDGAQGLHVVKSQGGIAIVQDPEEAAFNPMPLSAMKNNHVDYVLKVAEMPKKIMQLVDGPWQTIEADRAEEVLREFPGPGG
jgi:two-component system chemotaxis response regulator CheB